jgi:hypothetical protein
MVVRVGLPIAMTRRYFYQTAVPAALNPWSFDVFELLCKVNEC